MGKIRKLSTSRTGLSYDKLNINDRTIALYLPICDNRELFKQKYVAWALKLGMVLTHTKDIHYKRPFWKFWGMRDHDIAVFSVGYTD